MNFMDSSDDACVYMFTLDQKKRMQAVLSKTGPRNQLGSQVTDCETTLQAPIASSRTTLLSPTAITSANIQVYPNPTKNKLLLELPADLMHLGASTIRIYSAEGRVVFSRELPSATTKVMQEIKVTSWAPGIYVLKVTNSQGIWSKKIAVEEP